LIWLQKGIWTGHTQLNIRFVLCTTLFGRWFQWITVFTKKECWYCCFLFLLVAICQFICLNHHERRKLTPAYDEGSLEATGLHSDPNKRKKRYKGKNDTKKIMKTNRIFNWVCPVHIPFCNQINTSGLIYYCTCFLKYIGKIRSVRILLVLSTKLKAVKPLKGTICI
jgi:hypothetical protein